MTKTYKFVLMPYTSDVYEIGSLFKNFQTEEIRRSVSLVYQETIGPYLIPVKQFIFDNKKIKFTPDQIGFVKYTNRIKYQGPFKITHLHIQSIILNGGNCEVEMEEKGNKMQPIFLENKIIISLS